MSTPLPLRRSTTEHGGVPGAEQTIDLTPFDTTTSDLGAVLDWLNQA